METKEETVAQRALRLLEAVPAEDFLRSIFTDEKGKCCAIGHYMRLTSHDPNDYSMSNCCDRNYINKRVASYAGSDLRISSEQYLRTVHSEQDVTLSEVNNSAHINGYNQSEVKDRVIACLKDMVAAGY